MNLMVATAGLIRLELGVDGPETWLLDARAADLDEIALRRWARSQRRPDAETRVTRSYAYPYALVAWHTGPVGIDIERVQECDAAFLESISTPSERRIGLADGLDPDAHTISLWSAKEALSKALGDAVAYDPRRLESPLRWPHGRCGPWRAAALPAPAGHVAWLCWH
ncbi:MAG TPA: 4'-phosphopantetheinyl transferase superfamily protein [Solirubrobacteraceae bacterium]|nr:4'-phosphopantetheinyl transferase superfamily protein [Solirubrobacteraceae bacterium]